MEGNRGAFSDIHGAMKEIRSGRRSEDKIQAVMPLQRLAWEANASKELEREGIVTAILRFAQISQADLQEMEAPILAVLEDCNNQEGVKQLVDACSHSNPQVVFAAAYFVKVTISKDTIWKRMVAAGALPALVHMIQHQVVHCRGMAIATCSHLIVTKGKQFRDVLRRPDVDIVPRLVAVVSGEVQSANQKVTKGLYEKYIEKVEDGSPEAFALTMAHTRPLACRTLHYLCREDKRGVVAEILEPRNNAMIVLAKAVSELEMTFKTFPLSVINDILSSEKIESRRISSPAKQRVVVAAVDFMESSFLVAIPALIKHEWPSLAVSALENVHLAYSWIAIRAPQRLIELFPKVRMLPIVEKILPFLEALEGGSGTISAACLLSRLIHASNPAVTWPLAINPVKMIKNLAYTVQATQPHDAWSACSLMCRYLVPKTPEPGGPGV